MRRAITIALLALTISIPALAQQADPTDGCIAIARDPHSTNYVAAGCPWPTPIRISYTPFASSIFDRIRASLPASSSSPAPTPTAAAAPATAPAAAPVVPDHQAKTPKRTPSGERCDPNYVGCIVPLRKHGDVNCSDLNGATPELVDINIDPYGLDGTNGPDDGIACNKG